MSRRKLPPVGVEQLNPPPADAICFELDDSFWHYSVIDLHGGEYLGIEPRPDIFEWMKDSLVGVVQWTQGSHHPMIGLGGYLEPNKQPATSLLTLRTTFNKHSLYFHDEGDATLFRLKWL